MNKITLALLGLTALTLGCKDKDCDDTAGGCDSGDEADADTDVDAEVSVSWPDDSTLSVTVANLDNGGVFGMAETGSDNGWYGEDCVTGDECKAVINGDNTFTSVTAIDDVSSTTTLFNGTLHAQITYAVWDAATDECVHCSGDDCGYYADDGC